MGKMRQFRRMVRGVAGRPLAFQIRDGYGATLAAFLKGVAFNRVHDADIYAYMADEDIAGSAGDARRDLAETLATPQIVASNKAGQKATAVVSVRGIANYDLECQPLCFSTLLLSQNLNALANDPEIGTILLDIDSPGGQVTGTQEAADAVYNARKKKKVCALVNPLAASAAYWIASQAEEICAVPSGDIGSIGVFMAHTDCSAFNEQRGIKVTYVHAGPHKVEGNPDEPLAEEAREYFQSEVDGIYRSFLGAVARGRGVDVSVVEGKFGGGRTLMAPAAKRAGMIDHIATVDQAMARYGVTTMSIHGRRRAEAAATDITEAVQAADPMDGVSAVSFIEVVADGHKSVYVSSEWPAKVAVSRDLLSSAGDVVNADTNEAGDEFIEFSVTNGRALYKVVHTDEDHGRFVCELQDGSTYEPFVLGIDGGSSGDDVTATTAVTEGSLVAEGGVAAEAVYDPNEPLVVSDEFLAEVAAQAAALEAKRAAAVRARRLALLKAR